MKLQTDNPYNEVIDIIKASSGFYYTDYIVRVRIAGDEENVYLDCDGSGGFEWNYDWADVPSEDIELLGFCPFNKAMIPQEFMLKDFNSGGDMTDYVARFRSIADRIYEDRVKTAYDWLISRGWDGKDLEAAKKLAEGYALVRYPDFTWEVHKIPENATEAAEITASYCLRCPLHSDCDKKQCPYDSKKVTEEISVKR